MPPKAGTSASGARGRSNAGNTSSTLNANGQPKRKRTRGRGGRGRGGRGRKGSSDEEDEDDSSSSDSSSDDSGSSDSDDEEPVASTSHIATAPSAPAKSKGAATAGKAGVSSSTKSKSKGKASSIASSSEDDSDDDGSSSDSSSSSSSFLTTSDEDEDVPTPRGRLDQTQQQGGSIADGGSTYGQSRLDASAAAPSGAPAKRPEMTRPNDPPYIQFGADADAAYNIRAFGKPILWGLLPGDTLSTSSGLFNDENHGEGEGDDGDDRMKAIREQERQKAEERYLKFREDYVSKMISRFGSSLDQIRVKEGETMKESRLKVLIDSIALGADTFTSRNGQGIWRVDERREGEAIGDREVALEGLDVLEAQRGGNEKDDQEMEVVR